ncbi:hypothetical protein AUK11_04575 [bacterium CG2_30_37_16]|nr:MAG: hypothetical protein AUK11_04575 [bacterium CG2_30_37_16]PIP30454.1 MAG: hypothetical protein COX25_04605 [bacterium (Candidatus Howlettbacteria) CG23_combo_of_CG06-09_8_20_14_all_37_9]PIX99131.1 MAG: hypothetical protein COZ22_03345 [bacterium (Candidatus Howlettbacteria) CG_4_10_14_3_um_filter_37_10]PJB05497.1 MAG: hypothetical protein CO123_04060 [bacterium (Candidatus Howlettbacteria) CG_4_9_14_3_um_filter_37_10]
MNEQQKSTIYKSIVTNIFTIIISIFPGFIFFMILNGGEGQHASLWSYVIPVFIIYFILGLIIDKIAFIKDADNLRLYRTERYVVKIIVFLIPFVILSLGL